MPKVLTLQSYVRELPFNVRCKLSRMLDVGDFWERLVCIIPQNPDHLFLDKSADYDLRYSTEAVAQLRLHSQRTKTFLSDWETQKCQIRHLIQALVTANLVDAALYLHTDVLKLPPPLPAVPQFEHEPQPLPPVSQSEIGHPPLPPVSQSEIGHPPLPSVSQSEIGHPSLPPVSQSETGRLSPSPVSQLENGRPSLPPVSQLETEHVPVPQLDPVRQTSPQPPHSQEKSIPEDGCEEWKKMAVKQSDSPELPIVADLNLNPPSVGEVDAQLNSGASSSLKETSIDGSCEATVGSEEGALSPTSSEPSVGQVRSAPMGRMPEEVSEDVPLLAMEYGIMSTITDNFNMKNIKEGGNLIGTGGFGDVFLGVFRSGLKVAVKRLKNDSEEDWKQFNTEVETLCEYKHEHIVNLMGYCSDGERQCLVYQYMLNGSLEDRLACDYNTPPLSVGMRIEIARGTVKGMAYLHSRGVTHRDIKSANILLDGEYKPKVGDFATARVAPSGMTTKVFPATCIIGTQAYLAPEAWSEPKIHPSLDVYSFGVVLLELITGSGVYDSNREEKDLKLFVEDYCHEDIDENGVEVAGDIFDLRDPNVADGWTRPVVENLFHLSELCLERSRKRRIKTVDVLDKLQNVYLT